MLLLLVGVGAVVAWKELVQRWFGFNEIINEMILTEAAERVPR